MIAVTDRAKKELRARLQANTRDPDEGLRLLPGPAGTFVLARDIELPGDLVVEYEGAKVLLIGIEYLKALDGKTVDCHGTEDEPVLFVR